MKYHQSASSVCSQSNCLGLREYYAHITSKSQTHWQTEARQARLMKSEEKRQAEPSWRDIPRFHLFASLAFVLYVHSDKSLLWHESKGLMSSSE